MARGRLACVLVLSLLGNAFCVPVDVPRHRRGYNDNELDSDERSQSDLMSTDTSVDDSIVPINPAVTLPPVTNTYADKRKEFQAESFDDDDDDFPEMQTSSTGGGGSNIVSLLNLVSGLFPSSGGANRQAQQPSNSGSSGSSPIWTLKMDILRAILQFGTSVIALGSSSSSNAITQ